MPVRIQRKRVKGWRAPEGCVYVGRPTVWQNPFGLRGTACMIPVESREEAIEEFRHMVEGEARSVGGVPGYIQELRGKDVMCWCPLDRECHADILLEWANR
jgi:hypothetical protein